MSMHQTPGRPRNDHPRDATGDRTPAGGGTPGPATAPRAGLRTVLVVFTKAGLAFGGGLGILAVLEDELVTRRRLVSREEFLALYGIGRVVPSGTMTALAVAHGQRLAGWRGALLAPFVLFLPAFALTVALTALYAELHGSRVFALLPVTILPGALALILSAALRLGRPLLKVSVEPVLAAGAGLAAAVLHASPALLLLAGGLAGAVLLAEPEKPAS